MDLLKILILSIVATAVLFLFVPSTEADPLTIEIANDDEAEDILPTESSHPTLDLNLPLQYANYGEPCKQMTDCDSSAYLTCLNGSCQCALQDAMRFDDATSSCWVLPGKKCIYRTTEIGNDVLNIADLTVIAIAGGGGGSEERSALRADRLSFRCVSNSVCEDGFCNCDSGFFATMNGTCERQREYGEDCQTSAACRTSLHLICNKDTGKCGCNKTNSMFDTEHGLCVGLSGASCFDFELCAKNAYCPSFGIFNQYDVKCTCKPGYFENPESRSCQPKHSYGADCESNQECREDLNLVCHEIPQKCACNETTHVYDTSEGKCLSLAGSACSDMTSCISNAECAHAGFLNGNILARNMICRCAYGYFETEEKGCEKKREFDESCESDIMCRDELKLICNPQSNYCSCNETVHTYDRSKRRCISLAGTSCDRNEQCVFNSVCRSPGYLYPRHTPKAMCICKDGFAKSADGFCLGKYGSRCESWTQTCAEDLACRNGECGCPQGGNQQHYDYSSEKCVTYVGAPCNSSTTCVMNAHCNGTTQGDMMSFIRGSREGSSMCTCDRGFVSMDQGRKCLALVGQKCSEGDTSHGTYMPCVPHAKCDQGVCTCATDYYYTDEGLCERKRPYGETCLSPDQCQDNHCDMKGSFCSCNPVTSLFDPTRKTCMRLAGAKCFDLRDCVPNSMCRSPGRLNPGDKDATCVCKDGYFVNSNGTCEWKRGYGDTCTESKQCQDAADLTCSLQSHRCVCNETISTFDENRRSCVRLAGASCSSHAQCVSHAKCRNPLYWVHYDSFSPAAKCECESELGYTNSSDGKCIIDYYGGQCDIAAGHQCSTKFICEDGKCLCPYEDHQKYDYKQKNCVSLVKGPCDNTTHTLCVKNAHCVATEEGMTECRCKHGFIPVDRGCELTFGQACAVKLVTQSRWNYGRIYIHSNTYSNARNGDNSKNNSGESNESDEPRCDRLAPLKCVHGTCQCGGFQFYDYELQKCRGLVGSRCEVEERTAGFCTEGAFCEGYRSLQNAAGDSNNGTTTITRNKRYGRCKCLPGYVAEDNRTCTLVILKKRNN